MTGDLFRKIQVELLDGRDWSYDQTWGGAGKIAIRDDFSRLYLLKSGRSEVSFGNQTLSLSPGMLYLFPAGLTAWYQCLEPMRLCWVHFRLEYLPGIEFFSRSGSAHEALPPKTAETDFSLILNGLNARGPTEFLDATQALLRLIGPFLPEEWEKPENPSPAAQRLKPVLSYLDANFANPELSLKKLAGVIHLQPTYFSNLFRKIFGIAPIQLLTELRLRHARVLLLNTDKTLNEISFCCGYRDQFYFSRVFKKNTGQNPKQFRKSAALFDPRGNRV